MVPLFLLVLTLPALGAEPPRPCVLAAPSCMERVALDGEGRYSLIYRSYPLQVTNPRVRRALIVIHGAGRNAHSYFLSGIAGALIANALENTIVISPRLASNSGGTCRDTLERGEISWTCGGAEDWRGGGRAQDPPGVFVFDLIDAIVRKLADRERFPNLQVIVVTGHSAGGQFTNRYAAATQVEKVVQVPIKYVVSNPSTYLYLDDTRLPPKQTCSPKGGCTADFRPYAQRRQCPTFNHWRNGLEKKAGYAANIPDEELRRNLATRDVTYLLGELDTLPLFGFDDSCPAMAQGPNRFARGLAYWNYMRKRFGANHKLITVPNCGHNGRCMYTADEALQALFPPISE